MNLHSKIDKVKQLLREYSIDGWLFYSFQKSNMIARSFLELDPKMHLSRRFFYLISAENEPVKIVHRIEAHYYDHLPGKSFLYSSWQELEEGLFLALNQKKSLDASVEGDESVLEEVCKTFGHAFPDLSDGIADSKTIAMEYSPYNALPYISKVDAGTLECVKKCGVEVISSKDLLQHFISILSPEQEAMHRFAANVLQGCVKEAWEYIGNSLHEQILITEYDVALFIEKKINENGCVTNFLPIVSVNEHSANPHYGPASEGSTRIQKGDFVLIDLWCKKDHPNAIYADICRVAIVGAAPSREQENVFDVVKRAQCAAIELIKFKFSENASITGSEADLAAREVIEKAGFGEFFTHRTGHNIYENVHGNGTHLDSFETNDTRRLVPSTCFSVEPGIYLPGKFGIRLETDVLIDANGTVHITGGIQEAIHKI